MLKNLEVEVVMMELVLELMMAVLLVLVLVDVGSEDEEAAMDGVLVDGMVDSMVVERTGCTEEGTMVEDMVEDSYLVEGEMEE